ncbi:hypothetical protein ACQY1H_19090 [Agrobacterium vitis]|uniref:hypothetical protein n=1 Tax=Agrobacterium vitis TaxID=373 RepID=UPI003D2B1069
MREALDRPVCVATVYSEDEFLVTRSYLEAYGIIVGERGNPSNYRGVHLSRGLGGLAILVPQSQAEMAFDLLAETEGAPDDQEPKPAPPPDESPVTRTIILARAPGSVSKLFFGQGEGKAHDNDQHSDPKRILHDPRQSEAPDPLSGN